MATRFTCADLNIETNSFEVASALSKHYEVLIRIDNKYHYKFVRGKDCDIDDLPEKEPYGTVHRTYEISEAGSPVWVMSLPEHIIEERTRAYERSFLI